MSEFTAPVTAAMVEALDPQPGDEVLELAAGTGEVAAALAGRVARLLVTDLSPAMVEAARRRGLQGAEHRVLDLQQLELHGESFDKVACRFGFMLVADPAAAFRKTKRVLRTGGRLAFATWATADRNPWATPFGPSLVERGLTAPPARGEPGQFALGDPATIESAVRAAGFDAVDVREVEVVFRVASWEHYAEIQTAMSAALGEALAGVEARTRSAILDEARARFDAFRSTDGYAAPGVALVTSAA
jgi:SAM-dependent methyltransferase